VKAVTVGLVVAFAVVAVADWIAADRGDARIRPVTKTSATALLVAIAAIAGDMAGDARAALVVAVVLCLAGDIALLGESDSRFIAGLSAFAAGHLAYVVTALVVGVSWPRLAIAFPFLAVVLVFQTATGTLPGVRRQGGTVMMVAVACYSLIISAMVITATGTPFWSAAVGAMAFAVSDTIIGHNKFVKPVPRAQVAIMSTYHVGQLLLILGLIAAGE
jgi:uncharacterized membrane protein YhhN